MCDEYEHWNRIRYIRNLHCPEQATTSGTGLLLARDTGIRWKVNTVSSPGDLQVKLSGC